jgi:hypothetical protein
MEYYVRAAGGPSRKADVGRSYVTQPNGKVEAREQHFLLPDAVPKPLPGSTVFVPERDPADRPTDVLASVVVGAAAAALVVGVGRPLLYRAILLLERLTDPLVAGIHRRLSTKTLR